MDNLISEFLAESNEGLEQMDRCLVSLEAQPDDLDVVAEIFRSIHTLKGSAGFMGFPRLEKLAHSGEHLLSSLRDGRLVAGEKIVDGLLKMVDGLRSVLALVEKTGREGARRTDDDDDLLAMLTALNVSGGKGETQGTSREDDGERRAAHAVVGGEAVEVVTVPSLNENTLRIDVEVLNRMMDLVGELVLTRNQILQSSIELETFSQLARRLDSVTADLRETVMQARMQPLGHLFNKFPRMVRELAKTCGKAVKVEFAGGETALDKSLLEAVRDPLTHAVRNCIDHGFERPAQRIMAGKSAEGVLTLRASHQGGTVLIDVIDDGGGVPVEKVVRKAIGKGLVTAEQAGGMSRRELLNLIFLPGFWSLDEVTNVSGRGVGMDVIRTNVEKLGGSVEIDSTPGVGTHLRMRVPLTLAIVPALVVESGGQTFCVPQAALVELVYVPGRDAAAVVEWIGQTRLFRLREALLPMVWLDELLSLAEARQEHGFYVAVVGSDGGRFGLVVDELRAPEEIVVKPLSSALREIGLFSGASVLGNGTLALILDIAATAAYAGVRPVMEERLSVVSDAVPEAEREQVFLVFENQGKEPGGERTALMLDAVERIESVRIEEVEFVKGRPLLQYCGGLLPLEDADGVIAEAGSDRTAHLTVLICHRGAQKLGLVVRSVLDVAVGQCLAQTAGMGEASLVLIQERVTRLLVEYGGGESWRDVA